MYTRDKKGIFTASNCRQGPAPEGAPYRRTGSGQMSPFIRIGGDGSKGQDRRSQGIITDDVCT